MSFGKAKAVEKAKILKALIELNKVSKILDSFIPAFKDKTINKGNGRVWLHGNFNSTGTKSGRMSSNSINLQNLPATGSDYAKPIKKCFKSPKGWLLVSADAASLEDRISALTTKDPNKLKVYTDGYCGHCLRAYSYMGDKMPDIKQAKEADRCFSLKINGQVSLHKGSEFVKLSTGKIITVEEYYETNRRL